MLFLAGDVGLLLWGTHMVSTGVQRGYGGLLRQWLERNLSTRWAAFAAGIGITALLQSSTATGLMAVSFTESGVIALAPALAVMLGANVGTAIVAKVLSFDISLLAPPLLLSGVMIFRWSKGSHFKNIGRAAIGVGLMISALSGMQHTLAPVEAAPLLREVLAALSAEPLIAMIVAALLTWACHSSVAIVLFVASLTIGHVLGLQEALVLVLGANVGGAMPALVHASTPVARRLPLGNLLVRLLGAVLLLPLLGLVARGLHALPLPETRLAVDFHVMFNLALAVAFLPFVEHSAALLVRLLPEPPRPADPAKALYLETAALDSATVALANATRETLRMADMVDGMLRTSLDVFRGEDRGKAAAVAEADRAIRQLGSSIRSYLVAMSSEQTLDDSREGSRLQDILSAVINIEHVSDIVANSLIEYVVRFQKQGLALSPAEMQAIGAMHDELLESLKLAMAVFLRGDPADAQRLFDRKARLREMEAETTALVVRQLRESMVAVRAAGQDGTTIVDDSGVLRVARDLRRIHSHLATFAYPVLRSPGAGSRRRPRGERARPGGVDQAPSSWPDRQR
jgi:phosphate:Na+ symporter